MSPGPPSLEDLVRAICEGKAIDWDALEREGSPGFRNKLAALRVVESIARVHRESPPQVTAAEAPREALTAPPTRWGHLELLERLAGGAFGDVYRAWDPGLDREVALKLLRRSLDAEAHADEALEEGRLLARVTHPNVVTVFGAARIEGRAGIWMELVRGSTLADDLKRNGALPALRVASIGIALCDALAAVHAAGLLHRDVKAQNVMLGEDGRVVLMDFGAGGAMRHAGLEHGGTPLYLAPEVAAGGPATVQSDVYSLGVLLRYALTGSYAADAQPATRPRRSARLAEVLARATAASPHERFESAATFAAALGSFARPPRVHPVLAFTGSTLVAVLIVLSGTALHEFWPAYGGRSTEAPAKGLTLRPLWTKQLSDGLDMFGPPEHTGKVIPLTADGVHVVLADIDLAATRPGPALGAASDGLSACEPTSWLTLAPSAHAAAYSCQGAGGSYELRTMSLDPAHAQQRRLLVGAAVQPQEWSPNGSLVIERGDKAGSTLGIVNLASGAVEWVAPPRPGFGRASLSPDARWLAFDGSSDLDPSRMAVYIVGRSGGTPAVIAAGPTNSMLPTWTTDGRAVLFISDRTGSPGLWMQPIADGRVAGDPQLLTQDLGRVASVWAITPQGAYIYFRQTGLVRIATVPLDETGTVAAAPSELPTNQMGATMMPDWAPDGRRLVYQLRMTGAQNVTLGVMDLTRGTETNLKTTLRAFNHPRWSPDGRQIVVKGEDIEGRHGVFVVDVTSGETTALKVVPANAQDPLAGVMWAPDGTLVAGDAQGYVRIDSHTGRTGRLKGVTGAGSGFAISPVDQELALADVEDDTAVLRVVARGGVSREVLHGDKGERFVDLVWMPDGHNLLFVRGRTNTRLSSVRSAWRVDTRTGTAVPINLAIGGLRELALSRDGRKLAFTFGVPLREPWIIEHFLPLSKNGETRR